MRSLIALLAVVALIAQADAAVKMETMKIFTNSTFGTLCTPTADNGLACETDGGPKNSLVNQTTPGSTFQYTYTGKNDKGEAAVARGHSSTGETDKQGVTASFTVLQWNLPNGTILAEGVSFINTKGGASAPLAIIGGTGKYLGVYGTDEYVQESAEPGAAAYDLLTIYYPSQA